MIDGGVTRTRRRSTPLAGGDQAVPARPCAHFGAPRSTASPRSASRRRRTRTGTTRASRRSPSRSSRCSRRAAGDVGRDDLAPFDVRRAATGTRSVFVNGRFAPELSDLGTLPTGVEVSDLATAWATAPTSPTRSGTVASHESHAFTALNTAFMHDGAVVHIAQRRRGRAADPPAVRHRRRPRRKRDDASAQPHHRRAQREGDGDRELRRRRRDAMYFTNAVTEVIARRRRDAAALQDAARGRARVPRRHDRGRRRRATATTCRSRSPPARALSRTNVYTTLDGEGAARR